MTTCAGPAQRPRQDSVLPFDSPTTCACYKPGGRPPAVAPVVDLQVIPYPWYHICDQDAEVVMSVFVAETIGTAMLILLGCGVCANTSLSRSKASSAGWLTVNIGWGFAVAISVYLTNEFSGGHLNPAVSLGMAVLGKITWTELVIYVAGQFLGAVIGSALVWLAFFAHWGATEDKATKLGVFCTAPAIPHTIANLISEAIGTFVLMLGVLAIATPENLIPDSGFKEGFGPFLVGILVWAIGMSLGGPTGYAINPARDLGPRIAHFLLPIAGKGDSDWNYSWIPVVGPLVGAVLAALFYSAVWPVAAS